MKQRNRGYALSQTYALYLPESTAIAGEDESRESNPTNPQKDN